MFSVTALVAAVGCGALLNPPPKEAAPQQVKPMMPMQYPTKPMPDQQAQPDQTQQAIEVSAVPSPAPQRAMPPPTTPHPSSSRIVRRRTDDV